MPAKSFQRRRVDTLSAVGFFAGAAGVADGLACRAAAGFWRILVSDCVALLRCADGSGVRWP